VVVCVLACAAACEKSPTKPSEETARFGAQLLPASEVPPVQNIEVSGAGTALVTFKISRDSAGAISGAIADFQVNVSGFPASTALTGAHIHRGAVATNGIVVVDTGLGPGEVNLIAGIGSFTKIGIPLGPALMQEILDSPSTFYFDIHTLANPTGVARGQLIRQ
jgi:hypothetical protein